MNTTTKKKNMFNQRYRHSRRLRMGVLFAVISAICGIFLGMGILFLQNMPDAKPGHDDLLATPKKTLKKESEQKSGQIKRGVVVFTGGQGRVQAGFEVLQKFSSIGHLLISGVNPQTKQYEVLQHSGLDDDGAGFSGQLALDYKGQTTFGNITQTGVWAKKNNLSHVILVTSSYHIPRAKLLLQQKLPEVTVTIYPVFSQDVKWRVLAKEYLKYMAVHLNNLMGGIFFREKLK